MKRDYTMSDMDKVILTDCDGVLLNWAYAFKTWMFSKGYKVKYPEMRDVYGVQALYDLEEKQETSLIQEFNSSAAMGFLPPQRDAIHYVRKLHEDEGYVFHCITSMSADRNAHALRKMNLRKLFGPNVFERFIFLDTMEPKNEVLKQYEGSGYLWVEDHLENACAGRALGLDSVLIGHGYNQETLTNKHGIPRYGKWAGVYNRIIGE
jgi:FMN phosphatase YigB (HAD superfamily)